MTVVEYIQEGSARLKGAGVHCADPLQHMQLVVQSALEWDNTRLFNRRDTPISEIEKRKVENVLERRFRGEPLQYILGYAWFWDSKFSVGPGVLIPRKETEHTVDYLLSLPTAEELKVAELGPGSGNIGISVLRSRPNWKWHAFEKNPETIPYLMQNVSALLPQDASFFLQPGDFFEKALQSAPYDAVVSNPPYISKTEYATLALELKAEPSLALIGGDTGTEILDQLLRASREILKPGGYFVSEIASEQGSDAKALAVRHGFVNVNVLKDYAGLDRVLTARRG